MFMQIQIKTDRIANEHVKCVLDQKCLNRSLKPWMLTNALSTHETAYSTDLTCTCSKCTVNLGHNSVEMRNQCRNKTKS